jgi:lysozyme
MATVPGIDVSYWKSTVDWGKVRATGHAFAFIKATEGETYNDPTFGTNWSGTKNAGILRGAYCYFHPSQDALKQSSLFINAVKNTKDNGELPPVLDIEIPDGQDNNTIMAKAKAWLDAVEQALGRKPIVYSGYFFLRDNLCSPGGVPPTWSRDYPLWIAQYPNQYSPGLMPSLPNGWPQWTFWQYTEAGQVDGVGAKVDINLFNGSLTDLQQFAGARAQVQPAPAQSPAPVPVSAPVAAPAVGGGTPAPAAPPTRTYTVKPGDSLYAIAAKYSTTVAAIASANNIANPNLIQVGQVLKIPS